MRIQHNAAVLNSHNNIMKTANKMQKTYEKLSSGYKINGAADDAAGISISEKMRGQINGLAMAEKNIQNGLSLVQVADSGLAQINNPNLIRMRELAVQAANDTLTDADRALIQQEVQQLKQGINDIANNTEFNTIKLLNIGAVTPPPTTILDITVSPKEKKTVGYIEVKPGDTSPLEIFCDFSAIGASDFPDLNIVGPNGEIYGYLGPYFKNAGSKTVQNLPSASSGTYSGYGSKIESFIFHDPKPGKWSIIIDYSSTGPKADVSLNSNYSLNLPGTTPPTVQPPESLIIQKGPNAGHWMELELTDARTEALGIDGLDLSSREGAEKAIALLDAASGKVSTERSKFGAYMNVLEHVQNNTGAYKESLTAAESRVRDADIAKMSITLSRNQLILQAAQSVTSQANQMSQGILELLK